VKISCLEPGLFNFPKEIKKIGIVNNIRYTFGVDSLNRYYKLSKAELTSPTYSDGAKTTESMADALADQKYFDEIVICDSALRTKDSLYRKETLNEGEISDLAEGLNVDAIISLEQLNIRAQKEILPRPDYNCIEGIVNVKMQPIVSIYVPTHKGPVFSIAPQDSIFWREDASSNSEVESLLPSNQKIVMESCDYAGTIPIKYLVPNWTNQNRIYFSNQLSTKLKNAAIYVANDNWENAASIWKSLYSKSSSNGTKMKMSYNLAVYYEITNKFDEAITYLNKSKDYLMANAKVNDADKLTGKSAYYYGVIKEYMSILEKRKDKLGILNIQLSRFSNENK
jgi:tetratricopeptide (TPR) repeat protein